MESPLDAPEVQEELRPARWVPSALLDLPPGESVSALRTPHRICLQALPATREGLAALLARSPFEITVELDSDDAPLRHVPVHEVHEARLAPDLPLDWAQYYWLADGLQDDLFELSHDPAAALARGRARLAAAEEAMRDAPHIQLCDTLRLEFAWSTRGNGSGPDVEKHGEPAQALQQYVRGLTGHLADHAANRAFAERARELVSLAERRRDLGLPPVSADAARLLSLYAQHRLFAAPWLTSPAGMIAGWHLLLSAHVLAIWSAGLLVQSKREPNLHEALLTSLWMLDQGLWRDETLVLGVLRNLNASEYTSPELAAALVTALRAAHARA